MHKKLTISPIIIIIAIACITKIVSMTSRIILNRELGLEAVSIFSLVNPIFVFAITLSTFSLPTVLSTLIAKQPNNAKKIFLSSLLIAISINIIFIFVIILFSNQIATHLLHNINTIYCIKLLAVVVPLTTISSIIKGYYMGKNEIILTTESSLVEELSRFISALLIINFFDSFDSSVKATFFVLVMIIGEIIQTTYLLLSSGTTYLKNMAKIKDIFNVDTNSLRQVMKLSLPLTTSRIITSFTYMLEPIVITSLIVFYNKDSNQLMLDYGVISSYIMPLLLFPGFFSNAISNNLLPSLSKNIENKEYLISKKLFYQSLSLCFIIGLFFSLIFFFIGDILLNKIYHINQGLNEIKMLSLPFIIYYIESPINITMHAINKSNESFKSSLIAAIVRIIVLFITFKHFDINALCIAVLISCYLDVLLNYLHIRRFFKRNNV